MNHTEKAIPVWKKYSLNVSEASRILRNWRKEIEDKSQVKMEGRRFYLEVGSHIRLQKKII